MSVLSSTQQSPRQPSRAPNPAALGLLTDLLRRLHVAEIRYCQWKSNEHLDASMQGTTDLDVLVHRNDARRLERVLAEADFKPFGSSPVPTIRGSRTTWGAIPIRAGSATSTCTISSPWEKNSSKDTGFGGKTRR